jgi:hypothetical protein
MSAMLYLYKQESKHNLTFASKNKSAGNALQHYILPLTNRFLQNERVTGLTAGV